MQMRLSSSSVTNRDLIRYTDTSGNWGYYFTDIEGDGMGGREVFVANGGSATGAVALPTTKPREWRITLTAWGKSWADLQRARAEIARMFSPLEYATPAPPLTIEARVDSSRPWASIGAVCTSIECEETGDEKVFTATCRVSLLSPFPYWRVSGVSAQVSIPSTFNAKGIAAINFTNNTLITTTSGTASQQTRVAMSSAGVCVAGRTDGTVFYFDVNNGNVSVLGTMPNGGLCTGLAFLPNGNLVGACTNTNATLLWSGSAWQQMIATDGIIAYIAPFADGQNRYAVCGRFTSPRRFLFVVDAINHSAVRTEYVDLFGDLTFTAGQFECTDAFCVGSNIVAVGRNRDVSPHLRLIRVGNEFGRSNIASWNHMTGGFGNAPLRIAGFSLHDLIIGGSMTTMNVGVTGVQRVVRVRTLGGIELASDVDWCNTGVDSDTFVVKRVGSRIFGFTLRGAGDNWLLMWTGGGWAPIAWANNNIFDVAGNDNVVVYVGYFTQTRMYSTFSFSNNALMVEPASLPSNATYYGSVWTDGNGALVVGPSGTTSIPSHVLPSTTARLGTNYYGLAPGLFRQQATSNRLLLMLLGSTIGTQNITANAYYEDWRLA